VRNTAHSSYVLVINSTNLNFLGIPIANVVLKAISPFSRDLFRISKYISA
jgi:hypothetical protein